MTDLLLSSRTGGGASRVAAAMITAGVCAAASLLAAPALAEAPAGNSAAVPTQNAAPADITRLRTRLPDAVEVLKEARLHFDQEVNDYDTALKAVDDSDAHYRAAYRQCQQLAASIPQARAKGGQAAVDPITERETAANQSAQMWLGQIRRNDAAAAQLFTAIQQDHLYPFAAGAGQPLSAANDVRGYAASQHWTDTNPDLRFLSLNRSWPSAPALTGTGPDAAKQIAAAQRLVALADTVRPATVAYLQGLVNRYDAAVARLNSDQAQLKQANLALSRAGAQAHAPARSAPRYRGPNARAGAYNAASNRAMTQYYAAAARQNVTAIDARVNTDRRAAEDDLAAIKEYRLLFPQNFKELPTPGQTDLPTITRR